MRLLFAILLACVAPICADHAQKNEPLTISMNIGQGAIIELSDGKSYKIDPDDRLYSAYWVTPFPVKVTSNDNPNYPVTITNLSSDTSVKGIELSTEELIQESARYQGPSSEKPPSTPLIEPDIQPSPKPQMQPRTQPKQPLQDPKQK